MRRRWNLNLHKRLFVPINNTKCHSRMCPRFPSCYAFPTSENKQSLWSALFHPQHSNIPSRGWCQSSRLSHPALLFFHLCCTNSSLLPFNFPLSLQCAFSRCICNACQIAVRVQEERTCVRLCSCQQRRTIDGLEFGDNCPFQFLPYG